MYITYNEYAALYGVIDEKVFTRLSFDACRCLDRLTTGVDGVNKLRDAFPVDEYDSQSVKHCAGRMINFLYQVHEAEQSASMGRGYTQTPNGLQGKVLSSVSSGNESISFSTTNTELPADIAAKDFAAKESALRSIVKECLSGVTDANGVNLLYMGRYPV
jgi:hypothetical protein